MIAPELLVLRRQRAAEHLYSLGSRPVLHALERVANGESLDDVLKQYARLSPELVASIGADRFPPMPLRIIGGHQ